MAFHDVRFPTDVSRGMRGGPRFLTTVVGSSAGFEQRIGNWSEARRSYTCDLASWDSDRLAAIIAFFNARMGRLHSFRFKDWSDFYVGTRAAPGVYTSPVTIATGDGDETEFQLAKLYPSGPSTVVRKVTRPVSGTVRIYLNGILKAAGTDYSVDYSTGLVTFVAAPGNGVAIGWTGEFDVPARFDTDSLEFENRAVFSGSWQGIAIVEVRE
ncbi:MAG: DUF2460 domain-containing protein [Fimbriimonadaceae bacterium]|nr:DUF2460 domain-containing protein [Fimbriimonadaceae bacterium]QYK56675.1 MAG: DUF2460 domain-containing protein [Fimbriimonadaceae bacterium]